MKILAKQRLIAVQMSLDELVQKLLKREYPEDVGGIISDLVRERKITIQEYTEYFSKHFDVIIKDCINGQGNVTGNLGYDFYGLDEAGHNKSAMTLILQYSFNNIRGTKSLEKLYAKYCYSKYKDYIMPVYDMYYYDQVYKEFNDLTNDMIDEFESNENALNQYLSSKGLGKKAVFRW